MIHTNLSALLLIAIIFCVGVKKVDWNEIKMKIEIQGGDSEFLRN